MDKATKAHARLAAALKSANWAADQIPEMFRGMFNAQARQGLAQRIVADQEQAVPDTDDPQ